MSIRALWMDSDGEGAVVYDGRAFRDLVEALLSTGTLSGLAAHERSAGANMSVTLEAGRLVVESSYAANMGRYLVTVDADEEDIAVSTAPGSGTRRDILGVQVQDDAAGGPTDVREAVPLVVEGDTSGDDPALPASFEPLWRIRVPSGTVAITDSLMDDLRSPARLANDVIDTGAITTAKIADSAVTSAKIADATIVAADLASSVLSSSWTNLGFASGWVAPTNGNQRLRYKKIGNVVFLFGGMERTGANGTATMGTLPAGFRPPGNFGATANGGLGIDAQRMFINSDGTVVAVGSSTGEVRSMSLVFEAA